MMNENEREKRRAGGVIGGRARAAILSDAERQRIAAMGGRARAAKMTVKQRRAASLLMHAAKRHKAKESLYGGKASIGHE